MATKRVRNTYSPEQKKKILSEAKSNAMTAKMVQEKFGVTPVTFYSWKKAASGAKVSAKRATKKRGRTHVSDDIAGIEDELRQKVRAQIAAVLPRIKQEEMTAALKNFDAAPANPEPETLDMTPTA